MTTLKSLGLVLEDPPEPIRKAGPQTPKQEKIEFIKNNIKVGTWVRFATYSHPSTASNTVGDLKGMLNPAAWEVTQRTVNTKDVRVYVRMIMGVAK